MNTLGRFNYTLKKYPLFRAFLIFMVLAIVVFLVIIVNKRTKPVPEIQSIVPPVGAPGDVIIISGKNFGDIRDMSYVEFSGSKLTSSSYISWSDDKIKIVLPANVQDGLVVVGAKGMRSKPSLFANEVNIPVPVTTRAVVTKPIITSVSSAKCGIGELLTITGNNFGDNRNNSVVKFTSNYNGKTQDNGYKNIVVLTENMIKANPDEYDYVSWSNTEIKLYVPDGAYSGVMIVEKNNESSEPFDITISDDFGAKSYLNKKIYLLQYSADVADVITNDAATITLRCPKPVICASQPQVEETDINPAPVLSDYQHNIIHQITRGKNTAQKFVVNQTFVVTAYEVKTEVNPAKIPSYKYVNDTLYSVATTADELVPSDNEQIQEIVIKIAGKEKNPYKKAKLLYDYLCDFYRIDEKVRKADSNPLDMLKKHRGDSFDFAVIYTALLRASGIPAYTDAGVLVCQDMMTQAHWWCEFYIPQIGWIPVDPAIGAGLKYKNWSEGEEINAKDYYFGNLDSHHILFSRGWNQQKSFIHDNKIVQQPRSFALQSIWEEASSNVIKYSSYWTIPVVKGVY